MCIQLVNALNYRSLPGIAKGMANSRTATPSGAATMLIPLAYPQ
jgi:hypothetical protein